MTKQINVTYAPLDANAVLLLDGLVEQTVLGLIEKFYAGTEDIDITYGSALPVMQFRVFVNEGIIRTNDVQFLFEGAVVDHDSDGRIAHWPTGFCEYDMDLLERIL